jgi:glycosidase
MLLQAQRGVDLKRKLVTYIVLIGLALGAIGLGLGSVVTAPPANAAEATAANTAPSWMKNAVIYQVNVRQFSQKGDFDSVTAAMPRLKALGVDILWLMPIHPIGEVNRKGSLGSPYSVKDYKGINPDLGTATDFRELVTAAHNSGMKVILDWVANHTAWDNPWITQHKDWYTQDSQGNIVPPIPDWSDVADLNYDKPAMRLAMIDALKYWVGAFDIDGYRADVAGSVPTDFWDAATAQLRTIKPVFMLAEAQGNASLRSKSFVADYGWEFKDLLRDYGSGIAGKGEFIGYVLQQQLNYQTGTYPMLFVTNHDENSWNGSLSSMYGKGAKTLAVLTFTVPGIPLIYNGQEVDSNKQLKFFEKDLMDWNFTSTRSKTAQAFYTKLIALKTKNSSLWNGTAGGSYVRIKNDSSIMLTYSRVAKSGNKVIVVLNPSAMPVTSKVEFVKDGKTYFRYSDGAKVSFTGAKVTSLKAWGFEIYSTVKP